MPNTGPPILAWPNWSDSAVILSANETAGFEATQLQRIQPSDRWHTADLNDMEIVFDRGSIVPINTAAILYSNATAAASIAWDFANTEAELDTAGRVFSNHGGFNSGLLYDGSDSSIAADGSWVGITDFTIEFMLRPTVIQRCGIMRFGKAGGGDEAHVGMRPDGRIQFWNPNPAAPQSGLVISTTAAQVGVMMHVAVVYDDAADTTEIIIDGVSEATTSGVTAFQTGTNVLEPCFREPQTGGNRYAGFIDEIRLWDIARSAATVESERHAELTGGEANLASYWQLNDGSGGAAAEKSGGAAISLTTGGTPPTWRFPERLWASPGLDVYPRRHSFLWHKPGIACRFARVRVLDENNPDGIVRAGRACIGAAWQVTGTGGRRYGGGPMGIIDPSSRKLTPGGQTVVKRRGSRSTSRFTVISTSESQMKLDAREIEVQRGASRDVLAVLEPESDLYRHGSMIYGLMNRTQELLDTDFGIYERSYAIEELI